MIDETKLIEKIEARKEYLQPNYKNSAYCPHCGTKMEVEDETL